MHLPLRMSVSRLKRGGLPKAIRLVSSRIRAQTPGFEAVCFLQNRLACVSVLIWAQGHDPHFC